MRCVDYPPAGGIASVMPVTHVLFAVDSSGKFVESAGFSLWSNTNMSASNGNYRWLDDDGPAFGSPGLPPRWTSSEKDAVSTAYAASTKIWFTASHGTLNEIYYPTIDRPQTRDMELLFTDEETFFHEEKRDIGYDFHYIDENALAIRVTGHDVEWALHRDQGVHHRSAPCGGADEREDDRG